MFFNNESKEYIFQGNFGLEKESLRVTEDGYLANTPHPFNDKNISRDFCENQLEIITDVYQSVEALYDGLRGLNSYVQKTLKSLETPEYLWNFSNPPYFDGESGIHIATFDGISMHKQKYREYLAKKYGKRQMLYSGIHYNFSFSDNLLESLWDGKSSYDSFKSEIYLHLGRELSKYSWLLVALTSASPIYDCSLVNDTFLGIDGFNGCSSLRNSYQGYWNKFNIILDYSSLGRYVDSIKRLIDGGCISSIGECYIPIRLKPDGENSLESLKSGVNHIELRMFDLNPLDSVGIKVEDLYFTHYLIIYLLSLDVEPFTTQRQIEALENHKKASYFYLEDVVLTIDNQQVSLISKANEILNSMISFFKNFDDSFPIEVIVYQREKILNPQRRYSNQIYSIYKSDFVKKGIELSKEYTDKEVSKDV